MWSLSLWRCLGSAAAAAVALADGVHTWEGFLTLVPTIKDSPSGCHARVKASPSPLTSLTQALVRTSQNLTTPSLLTEQSSASLTGLNATFSMGAAWPFSSVEKRTLGFSGFPWALVSSKIGIA